MTKKFQEFLRLLPPKMVDELPKDHLNALYLNYRQTGFLKVSYEYHEDRPAIQVSDRRKPRPYPKSVKPITVNDIIDLHQHLNEHGLKGLI